MVVVASSSAPKARLDDSLGWSAAEAKIRLFAEAICDE
jgi:hypothetical protein